MSEWAVFLQCDHFKYQKMRMAALCFKALGGYSSTCCEMFTCVLYEFDIGDYNL